MPTAQTGKTTRSVRKAPPAAASTAGKPASALATRKSVPAQNAKPAIGSPQWQEMVATAAYYRAEARGFRGGSPQQDWLEAEAEIMTLFGIRNGSADGGSKPAKAKAGKR